MENLSHIRNVWLNLRISQSPFSYEGIYSSNEVSIQLIYTRETHVIRMKLDSDVSYVSKFGNIKFKGIDFNYQEQDSIQVIDIILHDDSLISPFNGFILDLLSSMIEVSGTEQSVTCLLSTLHTWINFFKSISTRKLTEEEQLGLYGELFFIKKMVEKSIDINRLVERWIGPDRKEKDFAFDDVLVEVKATKAKAPVIRISSENQLNNPSKTDFFLSLFIFDQMPGDFDTLNCMVENLKVLMDNNSKWIFKDKLEQVGYFREDKEYYSGVRYILRDDLHYRILKDFPKIIYGEVMEGIHNVEYSIQPSACSEFKGNIENITNLI